MASLLRTALLRHCKLDGRVTQCHVRLLVRTNIQYCTDSETKQQSKRCIVLTAYRTIHTSASRFTEHGDLYESLAKSIAKLESARFHGYSVLKMGAFIIFFSALGLVIFWEAVLDNVADEVSTVASRTLSDRELQLKTQQLTIELLHTIFQSPDIRRDAVAFLEGVFQYPETQTAVRNLLLRVITDKDTVKQLSSLLKDALNQSLRDPEFRTELAGNLKLLLADDNTKRAVLEILYYVLNDPDILEACKDFVQDILASKRVQWEASKLGKHVLNDVVNDPNTQKKTGDALWNVFQYSLIPAPSRWFRSSNKEGNTKKKKQSNQVSATDTETEVNKITDSSQNTDRESTTKELSLDDNLSAADADTKVNKLQSDSRQNKDGEGIIEESELNSEARK